MLNLIRTRKECALAGDAKPKKINFPRLCMTHVTFFGQNASGK